MEKNDPLLNLLFPNKPPKDWGSNKNYEEYIQKLGSYSCEDLLKEPRKLHEEKLTINEQTQELAVKNYKTFIRTAECSKKSFNQYTAVESKLKNLLENIPVFEEKCQNFIEESNKFNNLSKLNSITLTRNVQLLEILELPQLMDSFIKDNLYEDALELANYVNRLYTKHPDIPIFKIISGEVDRLWQILLHQLLKQLHTDLQLPKCLEIVGHLRRMGVFSEAELRLKFLQARNCWFEESLAAATTPQKDVNQHLNRIIEVTRVNLFNIVTQYRAVFNDDDHNPLLLSAKTKSVNQNCIFFSWLNHKIGEFLKTLEKNLVGCVSIDSFLGQCMYFGLSFSKVGCDFRLQLLPIFLKTIKGNFKDSIETATRDYEKNMEKFTLINKNYSSKLSWKNRETDPNQPPDSLLEFYPLADYANKLLTSLNTLRLCPPIGLVHDVVQIVQQSLIQVSNGIYVLHSQEHQAFNSNTKDVFSRLCVAFANEFVPFVQGCLHVVYPPSSIAQYLGVSVQSLQEEGIGYLDKEEVVKRISGLLPAKIAPSLE